MTYAKFGPRNWPGGIEAFYNFNGDSIPQSSIDLMNNSYYFEMIQFPVHHNVKGNLWMDAWSNDGRYCGMWCHIQTLLGFSKPIFHTELRITCPS